eukprot:scaffold5277_cov141-Skeletonema_menzelii.AAC.1
MKSYLSSNSTWHGSGADAPYNLTKTLTKIMMNNICSDHAIMPATCHNALMHASLMPWTSSSPT